MDRPVFEVTLRNKLRRKRIVGNTEWVCEESVYSWSNPQACLKPRLRPVSQIVEDVEEIEGSKVDASEQNDVIKRIKIEKSLPQSEVLSWGKSNDDIAYEMNVVEQKAWSRQSPGKGSRLLS